MDLGLPPDPDDPTEGLQLLEEIHALAPDTKVIVLTGQNDRANALQGDRARRVRFLRQAVRARDSDAGPSTARSACTSCRRRTGGCRSTQQPPAMSGIITRDPEMLRICRTIEKVAPTSATVLLLGESGTGKELLARALHDLSPRRGQRFVAINCAAIPENLLESELFGYEKGAFTGAAKQTIGKIETANGGTLFLDEIGDLPLSLQAKLLRFLQERVIERVGGRQEIPVDVRIVCATHQSLKDQIAAGKFREDLYYRLAEIVVEIPPLRARKGDAALLAHAFVRRFAAEQRRGAMTLLPDAIAAIEAHAWPGNVRELENVIKRAVIMADGTTITRGRHRPRARRRGDADVLNLRQVRDEAEKTAVAARARPRQRQSEQGGRDAGREPPDAVRSDARFGLK